MYKMLQDFEFFHFFITKVPLFCVFVERDFTPRNQLKHVFKFFTRLHT
jgi:hypothetical protein